MNPPAQVMFNFGFLFSNGILASYATYKAIVNPTADLLRLATVQMIWAIYYAGFCVVVIFIGSLTSREVIYYKYLPNYSSFTRNE